MQKVLYYRVKTGFGADEFIGITHDELGKAVRAQVNGTVAIFREGTISGNHIVSITPDFNRVLGLNRDYKLTGEDYRELGDKVVEEHRMALENAKLSLMDGNKDSIKKLN